jgi:hypothetical protein
LVFIDSTYNGPTFNITDDGQQLVIFLDGKSAKAALPDLAAGVVMLVVAAHVGGHQPHHVVAEFTILARPEE